MTEEEWFTCMKPAVMLDFIGNSASSRKLRLLGSACCRRGWARLPTGPVREIVEMVEEVAEGRGDFQVLMTLRDNTKDVDELYQHVRILGLNSLSTRFAKRVLSGAACIIACEGKTIFPDKMYEEASLQAEMIRCVFVNPFRPVNLDPDWLTSTVLALAGGMYESRDFTSMPILADALQDAGCDNVDILYHCRGDDLHVRGCWLVDALLGKE